MGTKHKTPPVTLLIHPLLSTIYRMIQNKRAKIKQDIGDVPLINLRSGTWGP